MDEQITMTFSGLMMSGKSKIVRVRFERKNEKLVSYAEGVLPGCKIESSAGFAGEEVQMLEDYLIEQKDFIWKEAEKIKKDIFTLFGDSTN